MSISRSPCLTGWHRALYLSLLSCMSASIAATTAIASTASTIVSTPATAAGTTSIIVQSTTSTANSGLYDYLLPVFTADHDIRVNVVAVGTGQAIRNASNCDGDVLLVHARDAEEAFVAEGGGIERLDVMYNDFVIVGPRDDPAGIAGGADAGKALQAIAMSASRFASRGDDSGTHKKELALWAAAGIDPQPASGGWYRETGSGMGATLNAGIGMGAYILTDRATWLSFANKQDFTVLVEGDEALFNQYGVTLVNPDRCPTVHAVAGQVFVDWLVSDTGQSTIAAYRLDGKQLFFPNAARGKADANKVDPNRADPNQVDPNQVDQKHETQ